jgi:hypothetical protein
MTIPAPLRAALSGRRPRLAALGLAAAALAVLAALAGRPGPARDELAVLGGGAPGAAAALADLARGLGGLAGELRAARLPTALAGAALTGLLAALGAALAGRGALLLAPLLFWAAPRHLDAALTAAPDLAAAALVLGTAWAYRRAAAAPRRRERALAAVAAGALFGGALALRPDSWILLAALALHAALLGIARGRALAPAGGAEPPRGIEARLHGVPLALAAMALLGPAVLLAATPSALAHPLGALASLAAAQRRAPGALGPLAALGLTLPASVAVTCAAGALHALARVARGVRARAPARVLADDLLLVLVPAAYVAAGAAGLGGPGPGPRPWLPAVPFLALAGARALIAAAAQAWPARAAPLAAVLASAALAPGALAVARAWPLGGAAWNEWAGGAPGAAARGLPRQHGGEAIRELLPELAARAAPGARVYWAGVPRHALELWAREGLLRPDLQVADEPEGADLAVVALDGGPRDLEYQAWAALRTDRPAAGVYVDEVPLAFAYARAGAWR